MVTLVSVPAGQLQHVMYPSAFRPCYNAKIQDIFCETNVFFPQKEKK